MNASMEYYKVFYYVCKTGSITRAAEELCISQPAVSQAVRQLERQLNTRLFIRTGKGVRLTREGTLLQSYVERGMESLLNGERMLQKMLDMEGGEVRIGASDMALRFYLLPYLEHFHQLYPKVKVMVSNGPTPETLGLLERGEIDFGLVSEPFAPGHRAQVFPVRQIRDIFVAGSRFEGLKGQVHTFEEIAGLPCICLEKNTSSRRFLDCHMEERGVRLEPEFELATSDMIVQFAVRNLGIGSVVEDFALDGLRSGELFKLELQEPLPSRNICVVISEDNPISTAAETLLNLMK